MAHCLPKPAVFSAELLSPALFPEHFQHSASSFAVLLFPYLLTITPVVTCFQKSGKGNGDLDLLKGGAGCLLCLEQVGRSGQSCFTAHLSPSHGCDAAELLCDTTASIVSRQGIISLHPPPIMLSVECLGGGEQVR